jgi:hypothetical protein
MDTPAQCSCGESWDQGVYAVGHAYSANAILEERLSTYLTALVEVGKAAANVRRQYEIDAVGPRWDIIKADVAKNNAAASINDIFAALDALTKAVQ